MPRVHDNVAGRTVAAAYYANGQIALRAAINTTAAVTKYGTYLIDMTDEGWMASVLALTTGTRRRYLGVAQKAVAASTAALATVSEFVIGGPTYIITTALPTTGYAVDLTTGAAVVASIAYAGTATQFGIWRATTTVASSTNACMLFGMHAIMTS